MMKIDVKDKTYNLVYNYNCFCDTDLLDRLGGVIGMMFTDDEKDNTPKSVLSDFKDMFVSLRELLYLGLQKNHSDDFPNFECVGEFIDDYVESNDKTINDLFADILEELANKGFLKDILQTENEGEGNVKKMPQKATTK